MERERHEDKSQDRTECSQSVLYEKCPHHTSVYCMRSVPTTPVCTVRGVSPPHTITPTHSTHHYHSLHPQLPFTPHTTPIYSTHHPHSLHPPPPLTHNILPPDTVHTGWLLFYSGTSLCYRPHTPHYLQQVLPYHSDTHHKMTDQCVSGCFLQSTHSTQ